jgi:hypothetical protein
MFHPFAEYAPTRIALIAACCSSVRTGCTRGRVLSSLMHRFGSKTQKRVAIHNDIVANVIFGSGEEKV